MVLVSAQGQFRSATKHLAHIRPRITTTDPNTPFAGMIPIASLTTPKTPIAASKDDIVHDFSLGLDGFALAGAELVVA